MRPRGGRGRAAATASRPSADREVGGHVGRDRHAVGEARPAIRAPAPMPAISATGPRPSTSGAPIRARPASSSSRPCSVSDSRRIITPTWSCEPRPVHCEVDHRYLVAPCPGSGSTACWRSAACSRPARARPRPCWPARCTSVRAAPRAAKPGQLVDADVELEVDAPPPYVSRGGVKLANALDALGLDVAGRRALDVGASTGGFTDCLLQRGAEHVVALDVAYGELDWRLRERRARDRDRAHQRARARRRRSCPTRPT